MLRFSVLFFGLLFSAQAQLDGGQGHIYEQVFNGVDVDGNHFITLAEFSAIVPAMDANGDGQISIQEFVAAFESVTAGAHSPAANHQAAVTLFSAIDNPATGSVPLSGMSKLFALFDSNGDGSVSNLEFRHEWENIHPQHGTGGQLG